MYPIYAEIIFFPPKINSVGGKLNPLFLKILKTESGISSLIGEIYMAPILN